jgi:hypothetical protein
MVLCNCKNSTCSCRLDDGNGISISGLGTSRNPYRADISETTLTGGVTSSATVTVDGSGTPEDPWVVSIEAEGSAVSSTVFTADGTWNKPPSGSIVRVVCIGGGGGGGVGTATSQPSGGGGGNGGSLSMAYFIMSDLIDNIPVQVGAGGNGAQAQTGDATGGSGESSYFGHYLLAPGGRGGKPQGTATSQELTQGGTWPDGGQGGAGAVRSGTSAVAATPMRNSLAPSGGGIGKGNSVMATEGGVQSAGNWVPGRGGEGGSADSGSFSAGKNGVIYGGGGGGGGVIDEASYEAYSDAGDGAQGIVIVTVW